MSVSASLVRWYFVLVVLGVSICIRVNTVTVRLRLVPSVFVSLLQVKILRLVCPFYNLFKILVCIDMQG